MRQEETVEDLKRSLGLEREDLVHTQHEIEQFESKLTRACRQRDLINLSIRDLERRIEECELRESYASLEIAYLELKVTLSPGEVTS